MKLLTYQGPTVKSPVDVLQERTAAAVKAAPNVGLKKMGQSARQRWLDRQSDKKHHNL